MKLHRIVVRCAICKCGEIVECEDYSVMNSDEKAARMIGYERARINTDGVVYTPLLCQRCQSRTGPLDLLRWVIMYAVGSYQTLKANDLAKKFEPFTADEVNAVACKLLADEIIEVDERGVLKLLDKEVV